MQFLPNITMISVSLQTLIGRLLRSGRHITFRSAIIAASLFCPAPAIGGFFQVEGEWLLVGVTRIEAATKRRAWRCDGELEPLIRGLNAPLVSVNWLHPSGCTRDWLATRAWSVSSTLALAKILRSTGFYELRQSGADAITKDSSARLSLILVKHGESARIDVWIHCLQATCQIFASESSTPNQAKSIARP